MAWLIFLVAAAAIFFAGNMLATNGDVIARRTSLGQIWVGALLIAGATSLPELTTATIAALRDAPNLAAGGIFGSNMANMAVLAFIALAYGHARVLQREAPGIMFTALLGIVLTGLASLFIIARFEHSIAGVFGYGSLALLAVVVAGTILLPRFREPNNAPAEEDRTEMPSVVRAGALFVAGAAVIFITAPVLIWAAEDIAETTGLAQSFVGVLGLALATSLPELATSAAAVRMGALNLAVGNIYGSNVMNIGILIWVDAIYTKAPLLETIDASNAVAGLVAVFLMMIGFTSMVLRVERRRFPFDPAATLILVAYVMGLLLTWSVSSA